MQWDSLVTDLDRSIRRHRKVLPESTIFETNANFPISDSGSRLMIFFETLNDFRSAVSSDRFSSGRRSSILSVSIIMPKYGSTVRGETTFSGASGIPRFSKTDRHSSRLS